jgi:5'-methylthioadenosine phosphorylase
VRGTPEAPAGSPASEAPVTATLPEEPLDGAAPDAPTIAVIGGSGFYTFLTDPVEEHVATPYGPPSAPVTVGEVGGRRVAFLPRHGRHHELPPHRVDYRANLWALRHLGVRRVIGPCAVGSLRPEIHPGDFVVLDQLVDRTTGRADTYIEGPDVDHVSFADPYCPELAAHLRVAAAGTGAAVHPTGTCVVIQGPRFSTRAESRWFRAAGWDVVGMTQYPEAYLARELGLCYAGLASVTDYDTGVEGDASVAPVTMEAVLAVLAANVDAIRGVLAAVIPALPAAPGCHCAASGASSLTRRP